MDNAVSFYEENKGKTFSLPEIPDTLSTNKEITDWIFSQNIPYIELDITFDLESWKKESEDAEESYVTHRETQAHKGWKSCCIHGIDVDKTGVWQCYTDSEPEYKWTTLSETTPTIKKFWTEFPFEKLARVRFMKLEGQGWVAPHNDSPPGFNKDFKLIDHLLPINIAITHPADCYMTFKNFGIIPWQEGNVKLMNITNDHSVINHSNKDRIHLIAHGLVGNRIEEFRSLIVRSYKKQYERNRV